VLISHSGMRSSLTAQIIIDSRRLRLCPTRGGAKNAADQNGHSFRSNLALQNGGGKGGDLVVPPIVPAAVYHLPGDPAGPYQYGRWSNPTWDALESALAVLEDEEIAVFPSGMAAIASIFYSQLKYGDRVLLPSDAYYTTRALAEKFLSPMGIVIESCPIAEFDTRS
jgi:cystathionine beta-lyase/cystathionine gamma-synthase